MAAPGRREDADGEDVPRLVAGKPYRIEGERLVKLGLEDWEREGLRWPAPDDHLLDYDQPWELVDGRLIAVPPAHDEHGESHLHLSALLASHLVAGYQGALDVLTRFGPTDNFAPDASVLPAYDPEHEPRPLEEIAFEIVSQQALSVSTTKARSMVARGVRRVFCLQLGRARVLEWDRAADDWRELSREAVIEDVCLARPLEVAVLLDTTRRDAAVVAALRARKVPELEAALEEREQQGRAEGRAEGRLEGSQARLLRLVERRLQRTPTQSERLTVTALVERGEDDALEDALLERDAAGLAAWLAERV